MKRTFSAIRYAVLSLVLLTIFAFGLAHAVPVSADCGGGPGSNCKGDVVPGPKSTVEQPAEEPSFVATFLVWLRTLHV